VGVVGGGGGGGGGIGGGGWCVLGREKRGGGGDGGGGGEVSPRCDLQDAWTTDVLKKKLCSPGFSHLINADVEERS